MGDCTKVSIGAEETFRRTGTVVSFGIEEFVPFDVGEVSSWFWSDV
jgi:hypothetical protein